MDGELSSKIGERKETVGVVEAALILAVAAFDLAVVARGIRTDELVADAQIGGGVLKQGVQVALRVGETVGKLKAVVSLDTLYLDTAASEPSDSFTQEVCRGEGALFWISGEEAQPRKLVDSRVLEQPFVGICQAAQWDNLDVDLDTLTWILHLLIRLGLVGFLPLGLRGQAKLAHYAEQALRTTGVSSLLQPVP